MSKTSITNIINLGILADEVSLVREFNLES